MVARLLLLGILVALTAGAARADNWERFRGPNGEGISHDKNIPTRFGPMDNVVWKVKIPGDGNGSPIVWGDRIFLQTSSLDGKTRSLICLDAKTGKEVWVRSIPGIIPKQSVRKDSSFASASPTTDGQAVYIPFWDGAEVIMVAYDFKGEKLWERNFGSFVSQHGPGNSPILYKDLLIFSVDQDAYKVIKDAKKKDAKTKKPIETKIPVKNPSVLYALDKKTGKTVWEKPREADRACYSMPFIVKRPGADEEMIFTSMTALTSYEPLTGKVNWYWTWTFANDPLRTIAATAYSDNMFLSCSGDGSGERLMVAVELKGKGNEVRPQRVWANSKQFPYTPGMLVKDGHVYFVNDAGVAGCFHIKTGKEVWYERLPDAKIYSSPLLIDGKMYACSEQGDVYVIAAETTYNLLAKNVMGERIRATPAIADGRMYLRTATQLYCIGKK